jgi:5-methylcytosine-specific restriction enzyme B
VARIAAKAHASAGCLREIQFSPGYTYEEFIEGPRFGDALKVETVPGAFLELNTRALDAPDKQFVLLIEEFSRADLPKVLGELLTYIEYRGDDDTFTTMYSRDHETRVAPNLAVLATYNPTDRSAVTVDAAIIRRLRILNFPPDTDLLREILQDNGIDAQVIAQLVAMFEACKAMTTPERFDDEMPFGHAVFSTVESEEDLYELWEQELRPLLLRPRTPPHPLYETIRESYPWRLGPDETVVQAGPQAAAAAAVQPGGDGSGAPSLSVGESPGVTQPSPGGTGTGA